MIDLDTGTVVTPPEEAFKDGSKSAIVWAEQHGIDAGGNVSEISRGLIGFDLIAVPVSNKSWDGSVLSSLQEIVALSKPGNPVFLSPGSALPTTFLFATREGAKGVVQITDFTDNPPGVKIRYKLVKARDTAPAATNSTSPGPFQFRLVVGENEADVPADLLPDPSDRSGQSTLRVSKGVLLDSSAVAILKVSQPKSNIKEAELQLQEMKPHQLAEVTANSVGRRLAIVWRGRVVSAPVVQSPISGPTLNITGNFTEEEYELLRNFFHRDVIGAQP